VWRWTDGDNCYIARANALEGNVSLHHTEGGHRLTIKYVDASVTGNQLHRHITGAGAVGVWTKADSVTAFDDFSFGGARMGRD
jgi:hypothetical protein